jgi:RNA polymerase subunit RPABC4/transcription elongation factor Spt4
LEEEALLQEIEEKPTCPGCGHRVHDDWQACPYCHTRLKKPCRHCVNLLELSWNLCPHCATDQTRYHPAEQSVRGSRHVQQTVQDFPTESPPSIPDKWLASENQAPQQETDYPQYVDDDYQ